MENGEKIRLCLEVTFLAALIILVWLVMFVPVTIFFLVSSVQRIGHSHYRKTLTTWGFESG